MDCLTPPHPHPQPRSPLSVGLRQPLSDSPPSQCLPALPCFPAFSISLTSYLTLPLTSAPALRTSFQTSQAGGEAWLALQTPVWGKYIFVGVNHVVQCRPRCTTLFSADHVCPILVGVGHFGPAPVGHQCHSLKPPILSCGSDCCGRQCSPASVGQKQSTHTLLRWGRMGRGIGLR